VSVDRLKRDFLSAAQEYKRKYKLEGENPEDLDKFKRLMDIYFHLDDINGGGGGGAVDSIIAGSNISISPVDGTGDVTINASTVLTDPTGYGSFFSDQTQAISVIDTPQIVTFNNTYEANDVYISSNRIYFNKAGTYQFAYVAQVFNISNDVQNCSFWIKYNGNDFPDSATHITLNPRKSSSEPSEQQMKLILSGTAQNAGDYIELYWQGTSTDLSLGYVASGPGEAPVDSPSVIANIIPIGAQGRDQNLQEVTDAGSTTTNSIEVDGIHINGDFTNYNKNLPDIGQVQTSDARGYGNDYVSEKTLAYCRVGSNAFDQEGAIRIKNNLFETYIDGAWQTIVTNFRFREDENGDYELEHKPLGFNEWIEVNSGNSNKLGLNGLPIVQQYKVSMGAYPVPLEIDGGTF